MFSLLTIPLIILLLLICSAFFSAAETALTAASRTKMHTLAKEGNKKASLINQLRSQSERLIGTMLLGNTLVNILASALATSFFLSLFDELGVLYATVLITFLTVIFAEVLPKTYALNYADALALRLAPFIRLIMITFHPVVVSMQTIVNLALKIMGVKVESTLGQSLSDEELRGAIDLHHDPHVPVHNKRAMLRSILDLKEVHVSEIMIHRQTVNMFDVGMPLEDMINKLMSSHYTRIPLWEGNPDNIIGILHVRTLLKYLKQKQGNIEELQIRHLLLNPWFVPETTPLLDQLQAFKERREHFAVVVDEFGTFMGIVTLEDILEEIVGQITDEYDEAVSKIQVQDQGSYVVAGSMTIRDLNREFDWDLPDENAATLGGLLLYEARDIPTVGQVFEFYNFRFEILKRQGNKITHIKVTPPL
jgi:Mg2+/Co2+ transporter CorB